MSEKVTVQSTHDEFKKLIEYHNQIEVLKDKVDNLKLRFFIRTKIEGNPDDWKMEGNPISGEITFTCINPVKMVQPFPNVPEKGD